MFKRAKYIMVVVILLAYQGLFAQTKSYTVNLAPFSSLSNDEFSPVYYKNGIVFCSNLKNNSLITYQHRQQKLFNIFFTPYNDSTRKVTISLLAEELTTNYNDGPVSFNADGDIIYFSRNSHIQQHIKDVSDTTNKMGIYSAQLIDGQWTEIKPFIHNNPQYSFVTPALTPDGDRLYFASDRPGGYGGYDLYYCDRKGDHWQEPVNLGAIINTPENESFPFAGPSGKLFFSSEGHEGLGGKDIYYTLENEGEWLSPIHLSADINSPHDDFGLVTDTQFENGYFSSNRNQRDDIFHFMADPVEFSHCDSIVRNNYCFLFYDERPNVHDTIPVIYEWDFGQNIIKTGLKVRHCFPGPGKYEVRLRIIDSLRSDSLLGKSAYKFELKEAEQVYINSVDAALVDQKIPFDGLSTNLPDFRVSDYLWNFDGVFNTRGPVVYKTFERKGEYTVKLGLLSKEDSLGNVSKACVYKKIRIFDDYQELATETAMEIGDLARIYSNDSDLADPLRFEKYDTITDGVMKHNMYSLAVRIYLLDDLSEDQKRELYKNLYVFRKGIIRMHDAGFDMASRQILTYLNKVLQVNPNLKLKIAVHSNENFFPGKNMEKTTQWASRIEAYFNNNGIPGHKIDCKGYGQSRITTGNNNNDGTEPKNRIEFIFMNNKEL